MSVAELNRKRQVVEQFLLGYRCGIDEVETKIRVLRREFASEQSYNPIESFSSRMKALPSLAAKARRRGLNTLEEIRAGITDIAGVRVICPFTADVYRVGKMLGQQDDVEVLQVKDYIAEPKPNGYRSLHLIVQIPVFLSSGALTVPVEVQMRTIAMDFWASLEHKIFYKYDGDVPARLVEDLTRTAESAASMDAQMQRLHEEMQSIRAHEGEPGVMTEAMFQTISQLAEQLED